MGKVAKEQDKLAGARQQGQAQFDSIKEMVEALGGWQVAAEAAGWEPFTDKFGVACWRDKTDGATFAGTAQELCEDQSIEPDDDAREAAVQTIHEDALSVQVRSDWYTLGHEREGLKPAEYEILLCTGGPACRIIGDLNEYGEPETATMEVQDWFTPWTIIRPLVAKDDYDSEPVMLAYARVFYFGD